MMSIKVNEKINFKIFVNYYIFSLFLLCLLSNNFEINLHNIYQINESFKLP